MFVAAALVLWLSACLTPSPALAGDLDKFYSMSIKDRCDWEIGTFKTGVEAREENYPRVINNITREQLEQWVHQGIVTRNPENGKLILPKTAMWFEEWNSIDDEAKQFIQSIVFSGWDYADKNMNNDTYSDDKVTEYYKYYTKCLERTASERRI